MITSTHTSFDRSKSKTGKAATSSKGLGYRWHLIPAYFLEWTENARKKFNSLHPNAP